MMKNELRSVMIKNGDTGNTLAEALGISAPALSNMLNGKRPFRFQDVAIISERYDLSGDDIDRIFFTLGVAQ